MRETSPSSSSSSPLSSNGGGGCQTILSAAKWSIDEDSFLSDFVQRHELPHFALITKGQYLGVGAPNSALPNLKPYVLVYAKRRTRKLVGQVVKLKEGKGGVMTNQKIAVPETYSGYFEILSEDGRAVKCLESVAELTQRFPDACVVRQTCKAYAADAADGELRNLYKTRTLREGETLTLCGEFHLKKQTFLRCFDDTGRSVYLKMSQKCKFSVLAKRDAITGVHTVDNLLSKRLPLTVRLIHGALAPDLHKASSSSGHLVIRLQAVVQEEEVFVCSVQKTEAQFFGLPLNAHLKLAPAANFTQLTQLSEFGEIVDLCEQVMGSYYDRLTPFNDHQFVADAKPAPPTPLTLLTINGEVYDDDAPAPNAADHTTSDLSVSDDEIDQLYDYIRGMAPIPPVLPPPPPNVDSMPSGRSNNSLSSPNHVERRRSSPIDGGEIRTRRISSPLMYRNNSMESPPPPMMTHRMMGTSPNGTAVRVAEKRLDDIIYGKNVGGGVSRRLSKSSDKLADDYHRSASNVNHLCHQPQAPPQLHHYYQQRRNNNNNNVTSHAYQPSSRQRPLSMVLMDGAPGGQPHAYSPPAHKSYHHQPPQRPPMHQAAYHSFANLTMLDGAEPPPPMYHSSSPPGGGLIDPSTSPSYFHFQPPPPPRQQVGYPNRYAPRYNVYHYPAGDFGL